MGTYRVPRNTKGESRILIIFSTKALIYTIVGVVIGYIINVILGLIGITGVGIVFIVVLALLGFSIATFKIPNITSIPAISSIAGESIDDIIIRYMKYKRNKKKIYIAERKPNTKEGEEVNGK